jgi:geranylgeranylglycerol-phosphate geranylgeranyltransferase
MPRVRACKTYAVESAGCGVGNSGRGRQDSPMTPRSARLRPSYRDLALCGTEYVRRVLGGQAPILEIPLGTFLREVAFALRPHFFALSGIAALAGAAGMDATAPSPWRLAVAAAICGLGWGVGQLLNDLLDYESDAINAPDRPVVAGRLPVGPVLALAVLLGLSLALATLVLQPRAWILVVASAILLVVYNAAKRWPLLGNLAHGALVSVAAAIGAAAVLDADAAFDSASVLRALSAQWRTQVMTAAIGVWYLQSNYEKDRPGDRAAGYTTLATLLSVRTSATLRSVGAVAIAASAYRLRLLPDPVAQTTMLVGTMVALGSTILPIARDTDAASLQAYRVAVPAAILMMLSLAAPLLGRWGTTAVLVFALMLVRAAFSRSPNA